MSALSLPLLLRGSYVDSSLFVGPLKEAFLRLKNEDPFLAWLERSPRSARLDPTEILREYGEAASRTVKPRRKTVDLSPAKRLLEVDEMATSLFREIFSDSQGQVTKYEKKILALRRGDSVRIGNTSVLLGNFLGRGDASHVFAALEVNRLPARGCALKLPFLYFPGMVEQSRRVMREFLEREASLSANLPHVSILDGDRELASFALVSLVHGEEHGMDFLLRLRSQSLNAEEEERKAQLYRLVEQVHEDKPASWFHEPREDVPDLQRWEVAARQFLWDQDLRTWMLVDWD